MPLFKDGENGDDLPAVQLYGVDDSTGNYVRVRVDPNGKVETTATVVTGDIEIGAVELKNGADDTRAKIGAGAGIVEADNALAVRDPAAVASLATLAGLDKNAGNTGAATLRVVTAADGPLNTAIGGINDAKVATDIVGSVSAKLRGLVAMAAAWARGAGVTDANTQRVIHASDDPAVVTLGALADAAVTDPTASASLVAALKGLLKLLGSSSAGGQGNKVVAAAGTPVQLAAATACTQVIITARSGNTKEIAYGWSNAVRAAAGGEIGAQLQPGDSVSLKVADLSQVWLDAQVNGEGVSYTYMTN